jgi:uncharacterized membrane protein YedE/YeeE
MDKAERRRQLGAFAILGFFALISIVTYMYNEYYVYLSVYIWFGLIYGMCLQYGRFCFSSAFRDLFAVGVPRMFVGVMIAIVLFGVIAAAVTASGLSLFHPAPTSAHSIIAGLVFGIGMVLAGGCASGSLYKTGEGSGAALIVVVSISIAQAIFVGAGGWLNGLVPQSWHDSALQKGLPASVTVGDGWFDQYLVGYVWNQPTLTFAKMLGLPNESISGAFVANLLVGVAIPAAVLLILVYLLWSRASFVKARRKEGRVESGFKQELAGYWAMIVSSRRTAIAGLVLGVAAGLHMLILQGLRMKFGVRNAGALLERTGWNFGISTNGTVFDPGYWYVTTQEAQWTGWLLDKLGWHSMDNVFFGYVNGIPNPIMNLPGWMSVGLIGGAAVMALLNNEFKFKKPTLELATWAIIGGTLMGIGARLGLGCNVGGFFVRVANGDPSGWLFGVGMIAGAYVGVKIFNWYTEWKMAKELAAVDF